MLLCILFCKWKVLNIYHFFQNGTEIAINYILHEKTILIFLKNKWCISHVKSSTANDILDNLDNLHFAIVMLCLFIIAVKLHCLATLFTINSQQGNKQILYFRIITKSRKVSPISSSLVPKIKIHKNHS